MVVCALQESATLALVGRGGRYGLGSGLRVWAPDARYFPPLAGRVGPGWVDGLKVQDAWLRLQEAARSRPVPFYLLPSKFPLNQLQRFYEALYRVTLDNRNFRKWVKGLPYVAATAEVETNVSRRPSQLYQFRAAAYETFRQATQLTPYQAPGNSKTTGAKINKYARPR